MMGQNFVMASDADISLPPNKLMASMVNVPFTMKVKSNGDVIEVIGLRESYRCYEKCDARFSIYQRV